MKRPQLGYGPRAWTLIAAAAVLLALAFASPCHAAEEWMTGVFEPIAKAQDIKPRSGVLAPRTAEAPAVDGRLDDPAWKAAGLISGFAEGTQRPAGRTEAMLLAHGPALYLGFRCHEPQMDKLRAEVKPPCTRNADVWQDDSVEVFIDPTGEARRHYQFIINSAGAVYYAENGGRELKWEAQFQSAAHRDKDFWSAEFGLPFAILGLEGKPNTSVKMQFCRTATPRREMTSWRPGWGDPAQFGPVVIDRQGHAPTLEEATLGNFAVGLNGLRLSVAHFPEGQYEARLKLDGKPVDPPLRFAGGNRVVTAPYRLDAQGRQVEAEFVVAQTDPKPERVLDSARRALYAPLPVAVSFRNAHLAENGRGRVWVRVQTGDAGLYPVTASVLNAAGAEVQRQVLTPAPAGAGQGWFEMNAAGLAPGAYALRVSTVEGVAAAQAAFHIERVSPPEVAAVPILVDEPIRRDWRAFPVTVGVPMPRAALDSAERVRIVDSAGRETPCQVAAVSSWNEDGRDARWLLADFLADSKAGEGGAYRLEFGRGVRRAAVQDAVVVNETEDAVMVDTGVLRLVVDRRKATVLRDAALAGRRLIGGEDGGLYLQDQDRKVFCSAWDAEPPEVGIEERGPIRATIRQQGWYAARDGRRLCRYDIRIHAFAGKPWLKVLHTWVLTHDSRAVRFGDISMRLPLAEPAQRVAFGPDDKFEATPVSASLAGRQRVSLVQEDSDRFVISAWENDAPQALHTGSRCAGWFGAWTAAGSVAAHVRDLWQQYPAELEATPRALAVHFWPEHGFSFQFRERPESYGVHRWPYTDSPFMDLQPREYVEKVLLRDKEKIHGYDKINAAGMAKTHEVWLDFGPATRPEAEAQEQARRFASPPAARADAAWIAATRVFRPFLPRDEKSFPTIEEQFRARWEGETYLQDRCHDYGLLHYGDRHSQDYPIGPNAKFQSVHRYWLVTDYRCGMEPWLLWARSGDRLYFRWAEVISRHLMDVDVVHWTLEDVTPPRRAGQFYPMSFAHYCSGVGSMSLHNDPIGFNQMAWFLTGYRRSLDVLLAAGRRELECDLTAGEMHRGHAVTGHNQLDVYRLTWDDRHWSSAFNAINKGLDAMTARTYLDPVYVWEWLHDIQDFTGDSRLKHAVLNIADRIIGQPRGTTNSYPAVYVFGHAYELTGDPRYIAWGKGKLEMDMSNIALSQDPERRGRVTAADNIHFTRLFRQAPGFLHYLKEAEAKHGPIARRTQPIKFIYERGPVYLREDTDRPFRVTLHLSFAAGANVRGEARLLSPDGKLAVRKAVDSEKMADLKNRLVFEVPADGQVGTYRLDLDVPTDGGKVQGTWGVECPDLAKIAHELTRFTFYGGHVFFHVPKGTKAFRLYVEPRRFAAAYGQPVVLGPDGRERLRLDGLKPEWVTIQPKPEDTDGVWGVVLFYIGVFQMDGLPPFVFSDPSEWFLPEAGARRPPDTKPAGAAAPR